MPTDNVIALPIGAKPRSQPLECPFTGVAAPEVDARGNVVGMTLMRAECGPSCALYDRVGKRAGCAGNPVVLAEKIAAALNAVALGMLAQAHVRGPAAP